MKTFKMLSFQLPEGDGWRQYPLEDGLLINQENSHKTWILETFLPIGERARFDELLASGEVFNARATISFPDNEPVLFRLVVTTMKEINGFVSVLMKGSLIRSKRKNPVDIMRELVHDLDGEQVDWDMLLEQFAKELGTK